ncbi:penicillin acylase family protein [Alteromonas stellipolaris]|uniref:penicillin acylase family protein n=1 Tax=Alteromonas stellipolaris TaxID=233316 RepID=UPI0026E17C44|nr:penicillin acylase family protein [Alteromonas stellipolaris]MDO6539726.1 penicillin acylase family protein [Alteromonas stellipolaris]
MLNWIKWLVLGAIALVVLALGGVYMALQLSLPTLDGNHATSRITAPATLARDNMGHAVINAQDKFDAAYALGFAHGQDRFFQMDLQRRSASGRLAEWVGDVALEIDKNARFHQFSKRAVKVFDSLPLTQKQLLVSYSHGVNAALDEYTVPPFEYIAAGLTLSPWQPTDSILVAYSMYLDLQGGQIEIDLARTALKETYGTPLYNFITQPSRYQAALDGSELALYHADVPPYPILPEPTSSESTPSEPVSPEPSSTDSVSGGDNIHSVAPITTEISLQTYNAEELPDIGSNNWAVTGNLTATGSGLLANDMHLGLRVPIIWYRTQLNYKDAPRATISEAYQNPDVSGVSSSVTSVSVTGVSLPGLPGVIVGTNNKVAWGFTNANLDNLDWIALADDTPTQMVDEVIVSKEVSHTYTLELSEYGPVKHVNGKRYALNWVAHHPFAVNLAIVNLGTANTVDDAIEVGKDIAIPTQNMVIVDNSGSAAWLPGGAVMNREQASFTAIDENTVTPTAPTRTTNLPVVKNPSSNRIWTANARVISADDVARLGDGGYALGARGQQIRDRLFEKDTFNENDFYAIQLDNHAQFLLPWQQLLSGLLLNDNIEFKADLAYLRKWGECACEDSVGYTLVKHFRKEVVSQLFGKILTSIDNQGVQSRSLLRGIEPAVWQLIHTQPDSWLPEGTESFDDLLVDAYRRAKHTLLDEYSPIEANMEDLRWGSVNALTVKHPFSQQIPFVGHKLNMDTVEGFGDTYMPAVQSATFGASERFFVSPGHLDDAILTLPGAQSGHPLSPFFKTGFSDYATQAATPLLPGKIIHLRQWYPKDEG